MIGFILTILIAGTTYETVDALHILRYTAGLTTLSYEEYERYDLNGDGVVDTTDALYVLRAIAGVTVVEMIPRIEITQ
jgi:hypothetical protein